MAEQEIICIVCPIGCRVKANVSREGEVSILSGNQCKKGEKYITDEVKLSVRVLTTTLPVEGNGGLLPVRTNQPIPKSKLRDCMYALAKMKVKPPVTIGQVIIPNICDTGADLISTGSLYSI